MLACELRQRVRDQLHLISPGEYEKVALGIERRLRQGHQPEPAGQPARPTDQLAGEACRGRGAWPGCQRRPWSILRFEMQATKGSGRIVPLGSIQKVMRESIEAAAQYVKAKHEELGITAEWRENYNIAILATFMGVPKEGPSAGIAIVMGIVSALKGVPVVTTSAMTGEITIMGKVLPVGGISRSCVLHSRLA